MKAPRNLEKYASVFSDDKFWHKLARAFKQAGVKVVYAALVLFYSLQDPRISKRDNALIIGALGYFILPFDLIPDFLPATTLPPCCWLSTRSASASHPK